MAKATPRLSSPYDNNVTEKSKSRYTQGGETDRYSKRVGWWERRDIEQRDDDIIYTISAREVGRPDLIAYNVYQSVQLSWLVLQYNNIVDIETELSINKVIRLPNHRRVALDIVTQPVGGNRV